MVKFSNIYNSLSRQHDHNNVGVSCTDPIHIFMISLIHDLPKAILSFTLKNIWSFTSLLQIRQDTHFQSGYIDNRPVTQWSLIDTVLNCFETLNHNHSSGFLDTVLSTNEDIYAQQSYLISKIFWRTLTNTMHDQNKR